MKITKKRYGNNFRPRKTTAKYEPYMHVLTRKKQMTLYVYQRSTAISIEENKKEKQWVTFYRITWTIMPHLLFLYLLQDNSQ